MNATILELSDIEKHYKNGDTTVRALDGVSLKIHRGEFVAIMGQSGSGKSTLMNILGCLDRPTAGSYKVLGREAANLEPDELASLRRETFGFVFQKYNLLATATAGENVEIPSVYAGLPKHKRAERAASLLARLGLGDRTGHRPSELSGGQQQRVAIARALVNDPPVILADEPTGALDSKSGDEVLALLKQLHAEGRTIILITHAENVAQHAGRIVRIQDGRILEDTGSFTDEATGKCRGKRSQFRKRRRLDGERAGSARHRLAFAARQHLSNHAYLARHHHRRRRRGRHAGGRRRQPAEGARPHQLLRDQFDVDPPRRRRHSQRRRYRHLGARRRRRDQGPAQYRNRSGRAQQPADGALRQHGLSNFGAGHRRRFSVGARLAGGRGPVLQQPTT